MRFHRPLICKKPDIAKTLVFAPGMNLIMDIYSKHSTDEVITENFVFIAVFSVVMNGLLLSYFVRKNNENYVTLFLLLNIYDILVSIVATVTMPVQIAFMIKQFETIHEIILVVNPFSTNAPDTIIMELSNKFEMNNQKISAFDYSAVPLYKNAIQAWSRLH